MRRDLSTRVCVLVWGILTSSRSEPQGCSLQWHVHPGMLCHSHLDSAARGDVACSLVRHASVPIMINLPVSYRHIPLLLFAGCPLPNLLFHTTAIQPSFKSLKRIHKLIATIWNGRPTSYISRVCPGRVVSLCSPFGSRHRRCNFAGGEGRAMVRPGAVLQSCRSL